MKAWTATLAVLAVLVQVTERAALLREDRLRPGPVSGWATSTACPARSPSSSRCPSPTTASGRSGSRPTSAPPACSSTRSFGLLFYGAFATKVLVVRNHDLPGWALPVAGGLVFTGLVRRVADERVLVLRHGGARAVKRVVQIVELLALLCAARVRRDALRQRARRCRRRRRRGARGRETEVPAEVDGADDLLRALRELPRRGRRRCRSGPKLSDGQVVERFPDVEDQIAVVTGGRGGMPSFEGKLSPEEIAAVVEYTRTL